MDDVSLKSALDMAVSHQMGLQNEDGYWWYTLEATEYICAEYIFLTRFMGVPDPAVETGLIRRILSCQRQDGTWALYYGGRPDLSTTIECYWALKLYRDTGSAGADPELAKLVAGAMERARPFILESGGITHARVFTKIHLALFGLVPWDACPAMPSELILMPNWSPVNIYEFSSWARSCIVPLLVIMNKKPVRPIRIYRDSSDVAGSNGRDGVEQNSGIFGLDELFVEEPSKRNWGYRTDASFLSWERFFINMDKVLKLTKKLPIAPFEGKAMKKCEEWIIEHIERTEDIFPALAYGAMALSCLGHPVTHPTISKAFRALRNFQQVYEGDELPSTASLNSNTKGLGSPNGRTVHQQCCISPVWDTPWQLTALLEAGVPPDNPRLIKAGRWLLKKQITATYGDWKFKNPDVRPGGWSFELENDFFPDVDDTIQVLHVLNRLAIPEEEKASAIELGFDWAVSMQNFDGGWGAFDKDQRLEVVNRIPFSDHGACLDPSSPDITARMVALLAGAAPKGRRYGAVIEKALKYLERTQESFGAWSGRWGVNYIYGTWCVLTALSGLKPSGDWLERIKMAADWLLSIQHADGGFSESPETYRLQEWSPYPSEVPKGVPSQTAWALMGLVAADSTIASYGDRYCKGRFRDPISRAAKFLMEGIRRDGTWEEKEFTGTGFPNHFYIRYHGYRHFFPLLALGKYARTL